MKRRFVGMVSTGHLVLDACQGALPALAPFLVTEHNLTYTAAGSIVFACNFASTIVQPLFGYAADRLLKTWIMPIALLLGGASIAAMGWMTTYQMVLLMAVLTGVGIAAFHPVAARLIYLAGGARKATAMGYFGMAGNVGFTIGPLVATWAVLQWGLRGSLFFMVPTAVVTAAFVIALNNMPASTSPSRTLASPPLSTDRHADRWGPFILLMTILTVRAILSYGLTIFIPLFWVAHLGRTPAAAGIALSLFCGANAVGSIIGGALADRFGKIRVIVWGFLLHVPPLAVLAWGNHPLQAMAMLIPLGVVLSVPFNPMIVMGQDYLPNHVGLSSGMTLGVAIGIGGMAGPLVGLIADYVGIQAALQSLILLPLVLVAMTMMLGAVTYRVGSREPGGAY
jgi:FSR family fosmidomycin resistance protein-like MFS transporter